MVRSGIASRIGLVYGGAGLAWVLVSSLAVSEMSPSSSSVSLEMVKGGAFVVVTAVLLYALAAHWERHLVAGKSELLRASGELGATNNLLSAILRGSQDLIAAWDVDQRLLMFNPGFERVFRDCLGNPIHVGMSIKEVFAGRECLRCSECWLRSLQGESVNELRQFSISGEAQWYDLHYSPLKGGSGEALGALLIARNVTDRVDADRRQRQHEQQLVQAIDHLTNLNRELQRFAFISSHDLQEPVRTVAWFARLLERNYGNKLDQIGREYLASAVEAATRLHQMINDLLVVSHVEGRSEAFDSVDAAQACRQAILTMDSVIAEAGAEVTVSELPVVWADEAQLVQLFRHLLANAVKFRRADAAPRIQVAATKADGRWMFSVADNGIGFDPGEQDVFELFRRLHPHEGYAGTGVGLAICKRIVEHHDGRIWVESRPGEGSAFHFTIPAWLPAADHGSSRQDVA